MITRILLGLVCAAVLAAPASAQTIRVRGTIEKVEGPVLTVTARSGETLTVRLTDDARVVGLEKASLADIKPGAFVGSTAMPEPDGRWIAVEVHIFPESMRGTGEGDRPYDYKPTSTMTNATVDAVTDGTVGSTVTQGGGATMLLKYKDGEKKITVTPETPIVMYAPGKLDELKPGAKIYIPAATWQPDKTLNAQRVNVGRGIAPPM